MGEIKRRYKGAEWGGGVDAEQKPGEWPAFKRKMEDENGRVEMWRNKGSGRADADRGEDDKVLT